MTERNKQRVFILNKLLLVTVVYKLMTDSVLLLDVCALLLETCTTTHSAFNVITLFDIYGCIYLPGGPGGKN